MFEHPTAAEMSEFLSSQLLVVMEHNAQEVAVVSTVPEQLSLRLVLSVNLMHVPVATPLAFMTNMPKKKASRTHISERCRWKERLICKRLQV